jgi:hypothetical protein
MLRWLDWKVFLGNIGGWMGGGGGGEATRGEENLGWIQGWHTQMQFAWTHATKWHKKEFDPLKISSLV